jgi:tetratricopeptide (TPR) repeat protein
VLIGAGKQREAVGVLESLPDVDAGGEISSLLVELYLDAGEMPRASALAERIFAREPSRHAVVQRVAAALLDKSEAERALALLQLIHSSVLGGGEHEQLSELLARVVEALPGRIEPLASLVELYKHTSDSFRLPDALIHLAEAHESAGNMDSALQAYAEFLEREPENEAVRRKQERLQARAGLAGTPPAAAAPVVVQPVEESEPLAPPAQPPAPEENLDQETQLFIGQAMTDVDLYSSYGLTQKALELLEIILQRAPDHPLALERLLDLSLGLSDDVRAVDLASRLERIYTECGNKAAADRFADLRRRFERTAAVQAAQAPQEAAPPAPAADSSSASAPPQPMAPSVPLEDVPVPMVTAVPSAPAPIAPSATLEFEIPVVDAQPELESPASADGEDAANMSNSVVHEVDLSEEWAALSGLPPETGASTPDDAVEAYDSMMSGLQESATPLESEPVAQIDPPLPERTAQPLAEAPAEPLPLTDLPAELPAEPVVEATIDAAADPLAQELLAEYELVLDGAAAAPANGDSNNIDGFMRSISAELDAILPAPATHPPSPPAATVQSSPAPAAKAPANHGPLGDLFEEFRADMGENGEREDPETHYNLGIAYREMGLMEEAISEFQKVASAHQQGQPFRYAMQCYTLLALAFAEKGQPSIAVSWYERALQVPGLDPETVLALRYDLGVSQEMAGDMEAAQKSFSQVYGMNIDYRDVAERLAALGRTR